MKKENTKTLLPAVYDCIFKSAFLDPELKEVLIELIHHITEIPISFLKSIEVRNVEYLVDNKKDKQMRSDIVVNVGRMYINIEMNRTYYDGLLKKNDAYLNKLKASRYKTSTSYLDAGEVIQINFDDFYHYKIRQDVYKFVYKEATTNEVDDDETVKYHICLPNIWDRCYNKPKEELSRFERYCMIIKTEKLEHAKYLAGDDKLMCKLVEKLETLSSDEEMIGLYNAEIEEAKIKRTMEEAAKRKGLQEGREEGLKEGREDVIKTLHNNNMSIEDISKYTDLSKEEVENIIKDVAN